MKPPQTLCYWRDEREKRLVKLVARALDVSESALARAAVLRAATDALRRLKSGEVPDRLLEELGLRDPHKNTGR